MASLLNDDNLPIEGDTRDPEVSADLAECRTQKCWSTYPMLRHPTEYITDSDENLERHTEVREHLVFIFGAVLPVSVDVVVAAVQTGVLR